MPLRKRKLEDEAAARPALQAEKQRAIARITEDVEDNCIYRGAAADFRVIFPYNYPFAPPRVSCEGPILPHPNITSAGAICLSVLRSTGPLGWTPARTLCDVLVGLTCLFQDPIVDDPINAAAAEAMSADPVAFEASVQALIGAAAGGGAGPATVT